jgi:hypothetical protein
LTRRVVDSSLAVFSQRCLANRGSSSPTIDAVFAHVRDTFDSLYVSGVHHGGVSKTDRMSDRTRQMIDEICMPSYRLCIEFACSGL